MGKIKLKPCPFCGEKDVSIETNDNYEQFVREESGREPKEGEYVYQVWCPSCVFMLENYEKGNKKELAEWWNKRVG
jgi:Lar family restriction alleviation protein